MFVIPISEFFDTSQINPESRARLSTKILGPLIPLSVLGRGAHRPLSGATMQATYSSTIKLLFTGDVMIGRGIDQVGAVVSEVMPGVTNEY